MTAQRLTGEQGFRIGARGFPLCSKAGLREAAVQMALQDARRGRIPIYCLFCGGENVRLDTYFFSESGIFFLRRAPGQARHSAACLLDVYAGTVEASAGRRVLAGVFGEERRSRGREDAANGAGGTELDLDRVASIGRFGSLAGHLFSQAYLGQRVLLGTGTQPARPEVALHLLFQDELLGAQILAEPAPLVYLDELARRGQEPLWGTADDVRLEAGDRDDLISISDSSRPTVLQLAISKGQRICGRLTTFGRRIAGPYFYFATARWSEPRPQAVNVFVHPIAVAGGEVCPVDSACERNWLAFAAAKEWACIKILGNKAVQPLLSALPPAIRTQIRKGLSYRWRPDFLCQQSGEWVVVEVAGMLGDSGYSNNLSEKLALWQPLARAGGFRHETYAPRGEGFDLISSSATIGESDFSPLLNRNSHLWPNSPGERKVSG